MIKANSAGFMNVCRPPVYTPEFHKNGKKISSKLVVPAISNNVGRKGEDGKRADKKPTYIDLTMWGKTADTYAKLLGVGKGFFCEMVVDDYRRGVFDENRQREFKKDGTPKQIITWGFTVVPGTIVLGQDGAKLIAEEKTSGERPIGYNGKITIEELKHAVNSGQDMQAFIAALEQAPAAWKNRCKEFSARKYTGGKTYGYATVKMPAGEGVECAYSLNAQSGEPKVDGFTYKDMTEAGWTNEQLLSAEGGKYASLVPSAMKATPAPPAPAAPVAPAPAQTFENAGV